MKRAIPKPLSWRPVLNGEVFCSPACGYGCTARAHQIAQRRAVDLCRTLGDGWTPIVWENLGWHTKAASACGRLKVHWSINSPNYTAFLGNGEIGGRWAAHGRTPMSACRNVIRRAREELLSVQALLDGLPSMSTNRRRR